MMRRIRHTRPLCEIGDQLLVAHGRALYLTDRAFARQAYLATLPGSPLKRVLSRFRLCRRILRMDPTVAVAMDAGQVLILAGRELWRLEIAAKQLVHEFTIPGGRKALNVTRCEGIAGIADGYYFGDYWDNGAMLAAASVWFRPLQEANWREAHRFAAGEFEHIHNIVPDPYRQCLWVLTGDWGQGSCIWQVRDDWREVVPVLRGEQRYRAVWLYPMEDALIYATDSNLEQNYLFRMRQAGGQWEVEQLAELPGSSIYAAALAEGVCFSTTVEPGKPSGNLVYDLLIENKLGPGILDDAARLYYYSPRTGLHELLRGKKDLFPMRLCQFGTFQFGASATHCYAYGAALKHYDDCLLAIDIPT